MRVLHFYKTYYPDSWGGVEQVIRQLCVGTGHLGITNEVLTLSRGGPSEIEFEGHTVHRVPLDFEIASRADARRQLSQLSGRPAAVHPQCQSARCRNARAHGDAHGTD